MISNSSDEKKPSPWVEHVKKVAKEKGISYMCAASLPETKASYQKPTKPKPEGKRAIKARQEEERIKELFKQPENDDILKALLAKVEKRIQSKATREKNKKEKETEYAKLNLEVNSKLGKYSDDQIKDKIESIIKNINKHEMYGKIPVDELIKIETDMWVDELDRRKKAKTAYTQRKEKEKKQKAIKEKKAVEKDLSSIAF